MKKIIILTVIALYSAAGFVKAQDSDKESFRAFLEKNLRLKYNFIYSFTEKTPYIKVEYTKGKYAYIDRNGTEYWE